MYEGAIHLMSQLPAESADIKRNKILVLIYLASPHSVRH